MSLIAKVAELRELEEIPEFCEKWEVLLTGRCFADGTKEAHIRLPRGGKCVVAYTMPLPVAKKITELRNAAPALLDILSEIRPGDDKLLALMILNNQQRWTDHNWQKAIDCLRRYQAIAARMGAESE